ncbi:hypothetical protein PENANT_c030G02421 [Penicillium antarcticum]|uniref:NmrA-like domain-containing protein n=1 Tax=Penicillium antarcticum TaxID=416450 RepID=A0A1V6PWA5_9EURO|nr:uncharacterized protein N7508_001443 [Penicillium antarcticum]KAJ5316935.1 hypothetical protein N7508_001443 [Penicillium antarcticum]OQD80992.1 hypothetical protein PENANT_c030G02421 [Penicillium antarcticum]
MISLPEIQSSNTQIANLPGLIAVFIGATNGIGEATLKEFARSAKSPRAYFVGRSQDAGNRITAECRQINPKGEYIFIKADLSLVRNVDDVCRQIQRKEKTINLLFLSCGGPRSGFDTPEGLHIMLATQYYARIRFTMNLLPQLKAATGLRRVVSVLAGGYEGQIYENDFQARNMNLLSLRGHVVSMTDMAFENLAAQAPEVSFINDYPGAVKTGLHREAEGFLMTLLVWVLAVIGPLFYIPIQESGERHLFFATSAKYPARLGEDGFGVPLGKEIEVANGLDGKVGSGVYSVHWSGVDSGEKVVRLLELLRGQGMVRKVWEHTVGEFERITGEVEAR